VTGSVDFNGVSVRLFERLHWQNFQGQLTFTEKSIAAKALEAQWGVSPVSVAIATQPKTIDVEIQGEHDVTLPDVEGWVPWHTTLRIPFDQKAGTARLDKDDASVRMVGQADLSALILNLPAPLNEEAMNQHQQRPQALHWDARIGESDIDVSAWLPELSHMRGQWRQDRDESWSLHHMGIQLGSSEPWQGTSSQSGIAVAGHLNQVALEKWLDYWPGLKAWSNDVAVLQSSDTVSSDAQTSQWAWMRAWSWLPSHVSMDELTYANAPLHNGKLTWVGLSNQADNKDAQRVVYAALFQEGALQVLQTQTDRLKVNVSRLHLDLPKDFTEKNLAAKVDCHPPATMDNLKKDILFSGRNIRINERTVSQVNFHWVETPQASRYKDLTIQVDEVSGRFKGHFDYDKQTHRSRLKGVLRANDVARMTRWLGIKKGFEGEKGVVEMDLTWPGDLTCASMKRTKGTVDFRFDDGVIKEAEPGLARVLGLLSVDSVLRRLRLDLRDVTEAGLLYNVIEGSGRFDRGRYHLSELRMTAPSAKATVTGDIDLISETLNLDARVTPAIGGSLPTIAALSGLVTPVVGVAAYAISKLIPGLNQDLVTYRYKISGSLDDIAVSKGKMGIELIEKEAQGAKPPKAMDPLDWEQ
jgi:uncharacterized protein YhdP